MLNITRKDDGPISTTNPISVNEYNLIVNALKNIVAVSGDKLDDDNTNQIMKASDMFIKYTLYTDNGVENSLAFVKEAQMIPVRNETYDDGAFIMSKVRYTNTGTVTCKVGDLADKIIYNAAGDELIGGELKAGNEYIFIYSADKNGFVYYNMLTENNDVNEDYAPTGGDESTPFKAADPVDNEDAVNVDTLDDVLANKTYDDVIIKNPTNKVILLEDGEVKITKRDGNNNEVNSIELKVDDTNVDVWNENVVITNDGLNIYGGDVIKADRGNELNKILDNPTANLGVVYKETIDTVECMCINLYHDGVGEVRRFIISGFLNDEVSGNGDIPHGAVSASASDLYVKSGYTLYMKDLNDDVWNIGSNSHGELGTGTTINGSKMMNINLKAKKIVASGNSIYLIDLSDKLWVCGANNLGQLGLGDNDDRYTFTDTGEEVLDIVASNYMALALRTNGEVCSTGLNEYGKLGVGDTTNRNAWTTTNITEDSLSVHCSTNTSYVIKAGNDLYGAGQGGGYALANNDGDDWLRFFSIKTDIATIVVHKYNLLMIDTVDSSLFIAGANYVSQLGNASTDPVKVPTDSGVEVKMAATYDTYSFIIDMDDKVWSTGKNDEGQLGLGHNNAKGIWTDTGMTAKFVVVENNAAFIIDLDDKVWSTGLNDLGQLGLGHANNVNAFTDTGKTAKAVSMSWANTFLIDLNNNVWGTGSNDRSQLGVGDFIDRDVFVAMTV